jgi:hypothetical protein
MRSAGAYPPWSCQSAEQHLAGRPLPALNTTATSDQATAGADDSAATAWGSTFHLAGMSAGRSRRRTRRARRGSTCRDPGLSAA